MNHAVDRTREPCCMLNGCVLSCLEVTSGTCRVADGTIYVAVGQRPPTAWLAVDWVNWSAHSKSKWASLTHVG